MPTQLSRRLPVDGKGTSHVSIRHSYLRRARAVGQHSGIGWEKFIFREGNDLRYNGENDARPPRGLSRERSFRRGSFRAFQWVENASNLAGRYPYFREENLSAEARWCVGSTTILHSRRPLTAASWLNMMGVKSQCTRANCLWSRLLGFMRRSWDAPCDHLNIMIARPAADVPPNASPWVANLPLQLVNLRKETTLAMFLDTFVQNLGREHPVFAEPKLAAQAETLLLSLLNFSLSNLPKIAPARISTMVAYYVRRAEEYISRRFGEVITMQKLAAACSVSVRTLHYGFAKYRSYTPLERLRVVGLMEARTNLAKADARF